MNIQGETVNKAPEPMNVMQMGPPDTWRDRLRWRLFPQQACMLPDTEHPEDFTDALVTEVTVILSWPDRIRMLLTGRGVLRAKVITQNVIGAFKMSTTFSVLHWRWLNKHRPKKR